MNDKAEEREARDEELTTSALAGAGQRSSTSDAAAQMEEERTQLFSPDEARALRTRWDEIQVGFVDEPRRCVEQADNLVAMAIKRMAEMFADERAKLEGQWDRGDDVSTEDLRQALRRYRSFFNRLLSI